MASDLTTMPGVRRVSRGSRSHVAPSSSASPAGIAIPVAQRAAYLDDRLNIAMATAVESLWMTLANSLGIGVPPALPRAYSLRTRNEQVR